MRLIPAYKVLKMPVSLFGDVTLSSDSPYKTGTGLHPIFDGVIIGPRQEQNLAVDIARMVFCYTRNPPFSTVTCQCNSGIVSATFPYSLPHVEKLQGGFAFRQSAMNGTLNPPPARTFPSRDFLCPIFSDIVRC